MTLPASSGLSSMTLFVPCLSGSLLQLSFYVSCNFLIRKAWNVIEIIRDCRRQKCCVATCMEDEVRLTMGRRAQTHSKCDARFAFKIARLSTRRVRKLREFTSQHCQRMVHPSLAASGMRFLSDHSVSGNDASANGAQQGSNGGATNTADQCSSCSDCKHSGLRGLAGRCRWGGRPEAHFGEYGGRSPQLRWTASEPVLPYYGMKDGL